MNTPERNRRILVVEDSATQAQRLRLILEGAGFTVVVAADGGAALEEFAAGEFGLVLSDVVMPRMSGYDLCRHIKTRPGAAATPVILLTTLERPTDIIHGLACGADNFIRKPIESSYLLQRVNHVLTAPRAVTPPLRTDVESIRTSFMGQEIVIDCGREQILEFLLSTFADYVRANEREQEIKALEGRQRTELEQARVREEFARKEKESLCESEAMFRSLLESSPVAMVIMDTDDRVVLVNSRLEELFGYSRQELVGQSADALLATRTWRQVRSGDQGSEEEDNGDGLQARRKDGRLFPAEISVSPISTSSRPLTAASIRDVTAQRAARDLLKKQAADLAQSNADLEKFAYVASHDLQEPLRVMAGYMQIFESRCRGTIDAETDGIIERVVGATRRMKTLIEDLLAYSRVGSGGDRFAPVDCQAAVTEAVENLRPAIDESKAGIVVDALPTVMADPGQLRQLFQNLLSNAIKYRGGRVPDIRVWAEREGNTWRVSVRDNGIGVDRQYWERIFVIFQRLHTLREYPGTGIGLAICKRIVERHGGRLSLESVPGQGSTFYFTIPVMEKNKEVAHVGRAA